MNEQAVLLYDPFDGGAEHVGDRVLSDKIVTARKELPCSICRQSTIKGSRIRVRKEMFDGDFATFRFCNECCEAMEMVDTDGGQALEARWAVADVAGETIL